MEGVMSESFTLQSMIRGYHVYKEVWDAVVGETLPCQQEGGNTHDPYAVATMKGRLIVGHVPREISAVCYKKFVLFAPALLIEHAALNRSRADN